jgi:hypothetical protein
VWQFTLTSSFTRTGTDGHRPIGRTWHASPLNHSSPGEAISFSTRNALPLPHSQTIRSHLLVMIRGFCLCLTTFTPDLIPAGKSRPRNGRPCSSGSSRGNRSVASLVITACHMRRSGVYFVPLVAAKWDMRAGITHLLSRAHSACIGRQRTQQVRRMLPGPVAQQQCSTGW